MAYHTKYRPKKFDDIVGNVETLRSVQNILGDDPGSNHAWLFTGPSGTGKTTIARIIARELGATGAGIIENNTAQFRGIDDTKKLIAQVQYRVPGSPVTVYILDECHQLTNDAQQLLLKPIEEPPAHAYFILCTTEPQKIKETIRTRCLHYKMEALQEKDVDDLLGDVAEREEIQLGDEVADAIIDAAAGSPRMALNLLQKVSDVAGDINAARPLLTAALAEAIDEGVLESAKKLTDPLLARDKPSWQEFARILERQVLAAERANADHIGNMKRALIGILGRTLVSAPRPWIAAAITELESGLFGANTRGGFIAILYKIYKAAGSGTGSSQESGNSGGRRERPSDNGRPRDLM
jgi:DNA polymerase III delta prime subunit